MDRAGPPARRPHRGLWLAKISNQLSVLSTFIIVVTVAGVLWTVISLLPS